MYYVFHSRYILPSSPALLKQLCCLGTFVTPSASNPRWRPDYPLRYRYRLLRNMTHRITSPYDTCFGDKIRKYVVPITITCWLSLVLTLIAIQPFGRLRFGPYSISDSPFVPDVNYAIPIHVLVDPKAETMFKAMWALAVVAHPFLSLVTWTAVFLFLYRRENGYIRAGLTFSFHALFVAVMITIFLLGQRATSTRPNLEAVLAFAPALTLAQAKSDWNRGMSQVRVGLAVSLSCGLVVSFIHMAIISLATLVPATRVPPRYEPTVFRRPKDRGWKLRFFSTSRRTLMLRLKLLRTCSASTKLNGNSARRGRSL